MVVIDTLSIALGDEDEKGPKAAGFVHRCLDLLKERPEFHSPYVNAYGLYKIGDWDDPEVAGLTSREIQEGDNEWREENGDPDGPVADHVIIIHHQTKTGTDFAGHRAIAADTHGLYRVHRFGKITDTERPYAGQLTPMRVKGIPRPAPIRFEVDVVTVEGTKQTAAILKDRVRAIPKDLAPVSYGSLRLK